ncbi:MAG: hypothetical protein OXL68_01630, partial [Paracoccaceae bacterium]|nr:hypothetical protein [Paracoccaceae bacterium]
LPRSLAAKPSSSGDGVFTISNVGRACLTFAQRNPGHYIATFESGISINAKQLRHYLAHDIVRVRGRISGTRRRTAQIGGFFHGHR